VDSNHCRHKSADLQSAPVGRLGTYPFLAEGGGIWVMSLVWQEAFVSAEEFVGGRKNEALTQTIA
jgi:hypothetical protein